MSVIGAAIQWFVEALTMPGMSVVDGDLHWRTAHGDVVRITTSREPFPTGWWS